MSDIAIRCEGLSKQYRIGERESYKALRDVIADAAASPFRRLRTAMSNGNGSGSSIRNPQSEIRNSFWALNDVSFEVKRGEVVGIIGRNGAGKSTLLKILSRITKPTRGHAEIHGRVGSLLEVGTGFHPELSGRENIYLNAAILGMRKTEVERKFDEIVAFADVEKFIDTPVKRYSSGMYVRLAFAVAAHMETEVLLIDEVLAVGDAEFQKKCLGKMGEAARGGRTVLFVSHNLAAVQAICSRAISINEGRVLKDGKPTDIVNDYLAGAANRSSSHRWCEPDCPQNEHIALYEVTVEAPAGEPTITVDTGLNLRVVFQNKRDGIHLDCTISVKNRQGIMLFESGALIEPVGNAHAGRYQVTTTVPGHLLNAGSYYVSVQFGLNQSHVLFKLKEVVAFDVENTATGRGANMHVTQGVIRPRLPWNQELIASE